MNFVMRWGAQSEPLPDAAAGVLPSAAAAVLRRRSHHRGSLVLLFLLLALAFPSLLHDHGAFRVLPVSGATWSSPLGSVLEGPGLTVGAVNVTRALKVNQTDVATLITSMQAQLAQLKQTNAQLSAGLGAAEAEVVTLQGQLAESEALLAALLTPVQLQATAGNGQAVVKWSMASTKVVASPGGQSCEASGLDGERCTVTGLANEQPYTFTAQLTNSAETGPLSPPSAAVTPTLVCRSLLVASAGYGGSVTASPTSSVGCLPGEYIPGTVVVVTAVPDPGYGMTWSSPDSAGLSYTVTVGETISAPPVVAAFAPCLALTVSTAAGSGSVAIVSPNSSAGCSDFSYVPDSRVVLKATPSEGLEFLGWTGAVSTQGPDAATLLFEMPTAAATVRAVFELSQCRPLVIHVSGNGAVSATPTKTVGCAESHYFGGASVSITATPAAGSYFVNWIGYVNSTDATVSGSMPNIPITMLATFRSYVVSASWVIGQTNFTGKEPNSPSVAAGGMDMPYAVVPHPGTGELYVSDAFNSRVLVFPVNSATPTRVIGQTDFTGTSANRGGSPANNTLFSPAGMAFDPTSGGLFVVDYGCHRVLYFPPNGADATRVYGQNGSFVSSEFEVKSAGSLYSPLGVAADSSGVFIADFGNHRVLFYEGNATTATKVWGQADFTSASSGTSPTKLSFPSSVALDGSGGMWVVDSGNHRVLYFPAGSIVATRVLGQADFVTGLANRGDTLSGLTLRNPYGVALQASGIFVVDSTNNRVLRFPLDATSSTPADRVYGQPGFTTAIFAFVTASRFHLPRSVAFDASGRMLVADQYNNRVLRFDAL